MAAIEVVVQQVLFAVFPLAMAYAAISDLMTMTISNRLTLILVAAFVVLSPLAGMDLGTFGLHWAAGGTVLAVAFACFAFGWIGGGDAKLASVTALWLGFGDTSKILLIFLGCMLPVTLGAYNGARGSEQTLMWSARSLGAGRLRMLMDVVFPSAVPEILNGIRTALATSFVLLVSSEMIAARSGLGFMIGFLGDGGNFDAMFAVVFTVAFLGFIADRLYQYAMQRTLQWR